jgi:hypothetical protein
LVQSDDDVDVEDETYQIFPRAARRAIFEYDDENMDGIEEREDELRRQVEEEEEDVAEGNANPQQRERIPFHFKPTIRRPHKPLSHNVICYRGKETTNEV